MYNNTYSGDFDMSKEEFKCSLIQECIKDHGRFPNEAEKAEIQKLADFAFNGE